MRIGILSRGKKNYSTRRLVRAANALGHRITVMDPFDCVLFVAARKPLITHNGRSVDRLDALMPRLSPQTAKYGLEVAAHFEWAGVPAINSTGAIEVARHKWRSLRVLAEWGLPVPPSFAAGSTAFLDKAVSRVGEYPFLIKPFEGTQGVGLMLLDTPRTAKSALDTLWNLRQDYIAQKFFEDAAGRDVRVLVVGGQALGAMERIASEGDFRANVHRGALGRSVPLTDELEDLALRATEAVGLQIAGVDILNTLQGPVILEVNPSPGFEGFEEATGRDVARAIMEFVADWAQQQTDSSLPLSPCAPVGKRGPG